MHVVLLYAVHHYAQTRPIGHTAQMRCHFFFTPVATGVIFAVHECVGWNNGAGACTQSTRARAPMSFPRTSMLTNEQVSGCKMR